MSHWLNLAWIFQVIIVAVESGCRRTNPVWTTNTTDLSVPTFRLQQGTKQQLASQLVLLDVRDSFISLDQGN